MVEEDKAEEVKEQDKEVSEETKKDDKLPAAKEDKKSLISAAKDAAAELRKANEEKAKLLKEEKEILDRREALAELGGDSHAGGKPEKKEESDKDYANNLINKPYGDVKVETPE